MQILGLSILLTFILLCFAGIIFWALVIQPRAERSSGNLTPADAWRVSGLGEFGSQGFSLYQIVPSPLMTKAEYLIRDESGREIGRYTGRGRKSGMLEYGGQRANLYIQGAPLGGSRYAGKVGGNSDDSIVIRDESRLIAEIRRNNVFPPIAYKCLYAGDPIEIVTGGLWPTGTGKITRNGERIAAFRRPSITSRNVFIAFRNDLADELKVCHCSITLLQ